MKQFGFAWCRTKVREFSRVSRARDLQYPILGLMFAAVVSGLIPGARASTGGGGAPQTITFTNDGDHYLSEGSFQLGVNVDSGNLPLVTSATTSVCTVGAFNASTNSVPVTLVATGTCSLKATVSGDDTYAPSSSSTSFQVKSQQLIAQHINFPAIPNHTVGDPAITLSARSDANLTVSFFSSSSTCYVTGINTLNFLHGGPCVVVASNAGNTVYAPGSAQQTVTINGIAQVVNFQPALNGTTQNVNVSPITLNATSSSGAAPSYTAYGNNAGTVVCDLSGNKLNLYTAGQCSVSATFAGTGDSAPAQATQNFTVAVTPLTTQNIVWGNSYSRVTGGTNVPFAVSADSGLQVQVSVSPASLCSFANNTLSTNAVSALSTCTVTASQAGNATYAPISATVNVYVTPPVLQTQTINWSNTYTNATAGTSLPLTATATSQLSVTISATPASICNYANGNLNTVANASGTCTVTASQAGNTTYAPITATQSVTVTPQALQTQTINWSNTYSNATAGSSLPLTASATSTLTVSINATPASVCSYANGTLSLVANASGTCTVTATQSGNSSYAAASASQQITVSSGAIQGDASAFVSQSVPLTMVVGQAYQVSVTYKNIGTTTWSPFTLYRLGAQNPPDNTTWGSSRITLPQIVNPGDTVTIPFQVYPPNTPGVANFQWQMVHDGANGWFSLAAPNVPVQVVPLGNPPTVTLSASSNNQRMTGSTPVAVTFTGNGAENSAMIKQLDLYVDTGTGYGTTPVQTITGNAATLNFNYVANLTAGVYRYKLRATDTAGRYTESTPPVIVNITNSNLLGAVGGIRSVASGAPTLVGWVCQSGVATALNYQVYLDAPNTTMGGTQLTSGTAGLTTEVDNAAVQTTCNTPGAGHHFNVDLSSYTAQYAGRELFVTAQGTTAGLSIVLPCNDNNCTVPGTTRIGLTTPNDGDHYSAGNPVFLRAKLTNVTGNVDKVIFVFGSQTIVGQADTAANTYYAQFNGVAASTTPYLAYAEVQQGNSNLYSVANRVYIDAGGGLGITITSPGDGDSILAGSNITVTANVNASTTAALAPVKSVQFYQNGNSIGSGTSDGNNNWNFSWNSVPAGSYALTAKALDANTNVIAMSGAVNFVVSATATGTGTGLPTSDATPIAVPITAPSQNNSIAGTLPGSLGVSSGGGATYSIPITVPPGVGGMVPTLSFNYGSQGGNGIMGLGWSIGGLSSIHRCDKTIAQDLTTNGVSFAKSDRLCLDGQRLILVTPGAGSTGDPDNDYWTVGAIYSTEVTAFNRISSYSGSKGIAFKVETKNGHVMTYGDGGDQTSYITAQGRSDGQALAWAMGQATDQLGNYYRISYSNDPTTGEYLAQQVQFGGAGQTAVATVKLNYSTGRADGNVRYVAGSHNDMVSLLNNVQVYLGAQASGTVVREYDIAYTTSASSGRNLVQSVTASAYNNQTQKLDALPPTMFTWGQADVPKFTQVGGNVRGPIAPPPFTLITPQYLLNIAQFDMIYWADFNGDGLLDAMVINPSAGIGHYVFEMYIAQKSGGYVQYNWQPPAPIQDTILARSRVQNPYRTPNGLAWTGLAWGFTGDFDGDGATDLFLFGGYICTSNMQNNPIGGFNCVDTGKDSFTGTPTDLSTAALLSFDPTDYLALDTTGSGRTDIIMRGGPYSYGKSYTRKDGSPDAPGTRCTSTGSGTGIQLQCGPYQSVTYTVTGNYAAVQDEYPPDYFNTNGAWVANHIADFNGDGRKDLYRLNTPPSGVGGGTEICTTNDTGFDCNYWAMNLVLNPLNLNVSGLTNFPAGVRNVSLVTDVNGDGLTDLVFSGAAYQTANGHNTYPAVCYSTGHSFDCKPVSVAQGDPSLDVVIDHIGAIDNDGSLKTLTYHYDQTGNSGSWRSCTLLNNALTCQPVAGGPVMGSAVNHTSYTGAWAADPATVIGNFVNDGALNLAAYDQSQDNTPINRYAGDPTKSPWTYYTLAGAHAADKLMSVTNGIKQVSSVEYLQGGQASVYTPYSNSVQPLTYPQQSVTNPGFLIAKRHEANGQGGTIDNSYTYNGLVTDLSGRGSLGFASTVVSNLQNGIQTTTQFHQDWPYVGLVDRTSTLASHQGCVISSSSNTYAYQIIGGVSKPVGNVYFPYSTGGTVKRTDLDCSSDLGTVTTSGILYDAYGNLKTSTVASQFAADANPFKTTTVNTYDTGNNLCVDAHGSAYIFDKLCSANVTRTNPDGTSITRVVNYRFDNHGVGKSETIESGHTNVANNDNLQVITNYVPDSFGNIVRKTQTWTDSQTMLSMSRTTSSTYTADGRFPASSTNAMGLIESYQFDSATGVKTQAIDINGLTSTWITDGFGRTLSETQPGLQAGASVVTPGNQIQHKLVNCNGDCPSGATTISITTQYNGGLQIAVPSLAYMDSLGHVLRTMSYGFDGRPVITDHTFDSQGRALANYQPVLANGATDPYPSGVLTNIQTLDDLNRGIQVQSYDTGGPSQVLTSTIAYNGPKHTLVNPKGQTRIEIHDVLGQLVEIDTLANSGANATTTKFWHDPFGNLTQTQDPTGHLITVKYDVLGHKIQLNDPDLGTINYSVDPVGRTWKQISPNEAKAGTFTSMRYDLLDRMINRAEPDLNGIWSFDVTGSTGVALTNAQITACQAAHSCGKLVESWTAPPANPSNKSSDSTFSYDTLGRLAQSVTTLDPMTGNVFTNQTAYDAWNRPITLTYQRGSDPLKVFGQRYNQYGYLQSIQRGSLYLWQATQQDAANRVTQIHLATAGGNATDGMFDTRCFDAYTGRMDQASVTSAANGAVSCNAAPTSSLLFESYTYDGLGNVQQRTESWNQGITGTVLSQYYSETFQYDGLNRILSSTVNGTQNSQATQSFTYLDDGGIASKTGMGNYSYLAGTHAVSSIDGVPGTFAYDLNGNQLQGNNRTTSWTSFDMPNTVTYAFNGFTSTSQFVYGPDHERRKRIDTGNTSRNVYYGGAQEVEMDQNNVLKSVKTYWPMGIGVEIDRPTQTTSELNWTHQDRLGSVVGITEQSGKLKEGMAFDAWGSRRNTNGAPVAYASPQVVEGADNKGFTGQEMLDQLELVHLNGRVYDPLVGKFLSGDPFVSDPANGQNYNRYSYVLNNPTNVTDPTGFSPAEDTYKGQQWGTVYQAGNSNDDTDDSEAGSSGDSNSGSGNSKDSSKRDDGQGKSGGKSNGTTSGKQNSSASQVAQSKIELIKMYLTNAATMRSMARDLWYTDRAAAKDLLEDAYLQENAAKFIAGDISVLVGLSLKTATSAKYSPAGSQQRMYEQPLKKDNDGNGGAGSNIVYRVIREDEDPAAGLTAKNPSATYTPQGHVVNGSKPGFESQFISTTRDFNVASFYASKTGNRIVAIDLLKVESNIIDLSTKEGRAMFLRGVTANNFAAASREVLIEKSVPANSIMWVK